MIPNEKVALDTSLLVGLVDSRDVWHPAALVLRDALKRAQGQIVCFDCVVGESISVLARRAEERKRSSEFSLLLTQMVSETPEELIVWISSETRRLYQEIIGLVRASAGALNFHDGLIALGCRELGIKWIASFDTDFDSVPWLKRVSTPNDLISNGGEL